MVKVSRLIKQNHNSVKPTVIIFHLSLQTPTHAPAADLSDEKVGGQPPGAVLRLKTCDHYPGLTILRPSDVLLHAELC